MDEQIHQAKRWVIKIGSALITDDGSGLNHQALENWAKQIAQLCSQGKEVLLVSSGSVAEGMARLGWKQRPKSIHELQAAAAVGQMGLVRAYETYFHKYGLQSAQILLTHDDLANRRRYLNTRSSLQTLLQLGIIPVINENDSVANDEIRFGDNDTLAALVGNLIDADVLLLLTDQIGLFDQDPRQNSAAKLIKQAKSNDETLLNYAGESASQLSLGGMRTKVIAAQRAAKSGTHTVIAAGREDNIITRISNGEHLGTRIMANHKPITSRKRWIANQLKSKGELTLDSGAIEAIAKNGNSLLPVGITAASGDFVRGDVVTCVDSSGRPIAIGLVNYEMIEVRKVAGKASDEMEALLGYIDESEIIHRDNLCVQPIQTG